MPASLSRLKIRRKTAYKIRYGGLHVVLLACCFSAFEIRFVIIRLDVRIVAGLAPAHRLLELVFHVIDCALPIA